jgi:uncharacterized protein YbdZ (MbtH family)
VQPLPIDIDHPAGWRTVTFVASRTDELIQRAGSQERCEDASNHHHH